MSVDSFYTSVFSTLFIYLLCPLVWSIEIKRGRENEKVGGKQAKLNERESGRELEKGGETALTSNVRGSKKETEKGGAILLTSNGRKSRKGCLLYTSPSPRDGLLSRMPSSA